MKKKVQKNAKKSNKSAKLASPKTKSVKSAAKGAVKRVLAKVASKLAKKAVKPAPAKKVAAKPAKKAVVPAKALKAEKPGKSVKEAKVEAPKGKGKGKAIEVPPAAAEAPVPEAEVVLLNAEGKQYCKSPDCDEAATSQGYCRLHYLTFWKRNKLKTKILEGGKLDKYIEELTAKYPDKYMEMLRKDLVSEKDFSAIIAEMDVEDSNDESEAEEETTRYIEEVRGGLGHGTGDDDEGF